MFVPPNPRTGEAKEAKRHYVAPSQGYTVKPYLKNKQQKREDLISETLTFKTLRHRLYLPFKQLVPTVTKAHFPFSILANPAMSA